ncbi:MAG: adenylate kinase [Candidatus Aenigmarchaeota archaeon]|nr:adenylate kinase [Candidatus Aenigmarchaeota archaeon]
MKLLFLGPPGAGKGTQAISVCKKYSLVHIATGDIFRKEFSEKSKLGVLAKSYMDKGNLVPNDITIKMVKKRLSQDDCVNGFVLDGFPRDVSQAESLEKICAIDYVVEIHCPDEQIVERLEGRLVCKCGATYNIVTNSPKVCGICDECGDRLYQRDDDKSEAIRKRLEIYHGTTEPLIAFYKLKGKYIMINGMQSIDGVFNSIVSELSRKF